MDCYAIGIRFGKKPFEWFIPGNNMTSFFANKALEKRKGEIIAFCEEMELNETRSIKKDGYYFYISRVASNNTVDEDNQEPNSIPPRLASDYTVVVVNQELNPKQTRWLNYHLLRKKIPMPEIAQKFDKYMQDSKVEDIKDGIEETRHVLLQNLDKLLDRGEKIENLVTKTNDLQTNAFSFKTEAEKLNSCWPSCTII